VLDPGADVHRAAGAVAVFGARSFPVTAAAIARIRLRCFNAAVQE
jgi:hypothetical protein